MRKVWVAGTLAILLAIGSGCGEQEAAPSRESTAPSSIDAVPAPTGTEDDPLAGSPVTALKDVLASWPLDDADPLVVTDLAAGRVDSFDDADTEALRGVTFAPDGSMVYVDGPTSLAVIGSDGRRRSIRVDGEVERIAIVVSPRCSGLWSTHGVSGPATGTPSQPTIRGVASTSCSPHPT